ncbi:cingulin-like protein 1 isoform X2 [Candoia aspera]|uniref:cingulin-like protein 1 isoform X2 n=1 Tax=Candoia aspera TaxID=51853 RepID=UPI002FD7E45B
MRSYSSGFRQQQQQHKHCATPPKLVTQETPKNTPNAKAGSYGVSIRVQGIDGHPYIVLNNTEGCLSANPAGPENGQPVASKAADRPVPDLPLPAVELEKKNHKERPSGGSCNNVPPSRIISLKQASMDEGKKTTSPFKAGISQSSNLLNFQRYPELLQPYNPANNILNLEGLQPPLFSKSQSLEDEGKLNSKPWNSSLKVALDVSAPQFAELAKSKPKTVDLTKPNPSKQQLECTSVADSPNGMHESLSSGGGSSCAVSSSVSQDTRKCRPDLLPLRQDSAGAVLNGSQKSSSSSTTPTSAASLYKFFLDDQEYAIYADNVNRHENRRYIPFLPGTGRDIDTGSIPAVDQLIEKFDRKVCSQRRGRLGFRNRIHPEDHKRAKSVDSALSYGPKVNSDRINEFTKSLGMSSEHLVQPSQVCLQKPLSPEQKSASLGERAAPWTAGKHQATAGMRDSPSSHFHSLQHLRQSQTNPESSSSTSSILPGQNRKSDNKTMVSTLLLPNCAASQNLSVETFASASKSAQVTPDLLKGQQELAQQTSEETAKQILYNYLKEGSENEDATKRKVNLVFEKIQTLKSRAAGSPQASDASVEIKMLVEEKKQLAKEFSMLQRKLDLELKNQQNVKAERQAMEAELRELQRQLEENMEEKDAFRRQLKESEKDLRENLEELFQVKMEREQHQKEIRDLQDQLSEMHDELDSAKLVEDNEKELLIEELVQLKQDQQELLILRDQQEEILRRRERELTALKGALKEEVSSHDREMDRLKEQHGRELQTLRDSVAKATEKIDALSSAKAKAEKMQQSQEDHVVGMTEQNCQLRKALVELEKKQEELHLQLENLRRGRDEAEERLRRSMKEMQSLGHAKEEARELASAKMSLEAQLEDAQRNISRLSQEQQQLMVCLNDEASQKDELRKMKSGLENERQQLDKTVERLHREMAEIIKVSQASTLELQNQLEEYKEKNWQELVNSQRQLKEKTLELEKTSQTILKMQEEAHFVEEELQGHKKALEEALTKTQLLEHTVKTLEYELETKNQLKEDRARQAKIMEDKISQLELELEEEQNSSDILSERVLRCREQIEQMRSELLQERALRQDLECDKVALERQNKDLKSRILHLEGSYKSSKEGLLVQMEAQIVELEERLEREERDRAHLQVTNRRLERTVKELLMQVDDEHLSLTDQKDQLSLRLKAMKRQVEEAEEEIDQLESTKKKLQRELEEQVDANDQLQRQLNAIRQDLRRKKTSSKLLSDFDCEDDDLSTDGESLYDAPLGFRSLKQS